jgi:electron transfer flavoprotein beta subunit
MKMIVCVKQVFDPEIPADWIKINSGGTGVIFETDVPKVRNPYDDYALEAALRIKDTSGGEITVLSLGTDFSRRVMKEALAMGADELVLVEDPLFTDIDTGATAFYLSAAIRTLGNSDLILCGRQAAPWDSGQVGLGIAEYLGIPCVNISSKIEMSGEILRIEKCLDDGHEVVEAALPLLVTVSNEIGKPRYPTLRGIRKATQMEPLVLGRANLQTADLELDGAPKPQPSPRLEQPKIEAECEFIDTEMPEEAGVLLADMLRAKKIL